MKNILPIIVLLLSNTCALLSQDTVNIQPEIQEIEAEKNAKYYPQSRMVGLNITPLLTQFIPFNRADPTEIGPYYIRFKNYKRGKNAVRFALGVSIVPDDFFGEDDNAFLHLQLGFERRKNITDRWSYTRGLDAVFSGGNFNLPGDNSNEDIAHLGIGLPWGMEYALAPRITISTETELLLLITDNGLSFRFLPPVGLFLNYYFTK
jgi:hypothetical protein